MKKGVKKFGALLGVLLIMCVSILTSFVDAVVFNTSASVTFIMPDHDVNLEAISEANGYTIIFNGNGNTNSGTTMSNLDMVYDTTGTLTANAYTKVGYTFLGWSTDSTATVATYTDGQQVNNLVTEGSITLYAIWSANTYQVRFNPNPGEDTLNGIVGTMSKQDFTYDTTGALRTNAYTRAGYEFLGWSTGSTATVATYTNGQEVSNLTTVSGDVVDLYAIWSANTDTKYTVNHYLMKVDGTYSEDPTYSGEFTATTYEVVSPTPRNDDGFTLSGSAQTGHVKGDGTTVFNYYYSRNQYSVTLHAGRGIANVSGGGTYYYNDSVAVSAILKPGYQELIWTGDKTTAAFNMPASAVDMTASATPITYTITLDVGSGTITGQKTTYNVEENFTLVDPTRTGYDFVGWSGTNLTSPTSGLVISGVYGDLSYEAVWSPRSDVHYLVRHYIKVVGEDRYEQTGDDVLYTTGVADETITLADYKRADIPCVTYAGGSLTQSNSGLTTAIETGSAIVQPDGSTVIYLYYTRNIHSVTLTKDDHIASVNLSGTIDNTVTKSFECGATVTIDADPSVGYHFLRWDDLGPDYLNPVNP